MTAIDNWISKIDNTMYEVQKNFIVSTHHETVEKEYLQKLQHEFGDSKFTLDAIQGFLASCTRKSSYELEGIQFTILCQKESKTIESKIILTLFRIKTICKLFHIQPKLKIVLLPIPEQRKKPTINEHVHPKHINGAYTYISEGTIYVYRLEEWPKVVLHEVLHNVPQLQRIAWTESHLSQLYTAFHIDRAGCPNACQTVLEPTEAVIEAWAIFLHTAFLSIEQGVDFCWLFNKELAWNDQQIRWVLHKQGKGLWQESTHTFSYIVLRGILLHHMGELLQMKLPYSCDRLIQFLLQHWNPLKLKIMKLPYKKNRSLRMSRLGDL